MKRIISTGIFLALGTIVSIPGSAIVIRHDREDSRYRDLAAEYPQAVSILPDGAGALVAPTWVLTAAHVAKGVSGRGIRIEAGDREYRIRRIFIHPGWDDMGPHDIALLELTEPVQGIAPAELYAGSDEVGRTVVFVGKGDFGTGATGPIKQDRIPRGATNMVVEADEHWLYFDFDQGAEATELEGVSGPGDSGGPALLRDSDRVYTLGVSVFAMGDEGPGHYGVREGYTRVSTHLDWIRSVLAGKADDTAVLPGEASRSPGSRRVEITGGTGKLPDTSAGEQIRAWVSAYNTADPSIMAGYISEGFSSDYREYRSQQEHLQHYQRLFDMLGTISLRTVTNVGEDSITALFDTAKGGLAEVRFTLVNPESPRIDGIRIAQVSID